MHADLARAEREWIVENAENQCSELVGQRSVIGWLVFQFVAESMRQRVIGDCRLIGFALKGYGPV